jgi:uncharacterized protein
LRRLIRHSNFILFFVISIFFFFSKPYLNLYSDLLSLLPQNKQIKNVRAYEHLFLNNEILLAVKGNNLEEIKKLEKKVLSHDFINLKQNPLTSESFLKYLKEYRFYLSEFDKKNIFSIEKKLQEQYQNLLTNPYYVFLDTKDPLSLFRTKSKVKNILFKNGRLFLPDYGYMSIFSYNQGTDIKKVYDVFAPLINKKTKVFSPIFYFVENKQAIKSQVNFLIFLALGILLILYIVILRDFFLLTNTIVTLLSGMMLSFVFISLFWEKISLLVVVFGISISTVAIDYMFHHYFLGFYEKAKGFNKSVFLGFISTFFAFILLSFVDFPFIRQTSLFSAFSLAYSYVVFSFIFPKIRFKKYSFAFSLPEYGLLKNYRYFTVALLFVLVYLLANIHLDLNIKNLDYQNQKVKMQEQFFKDKLDIQKNIFILKANSIDTLIQKSRTLSALHVKLNAPLSSLLNKKEYEKRKALFQSINFDDIKKKIDMYSKQIGFRNNFFSNAYERKLLYPKVPTYNLEKLQEYGFDIYYDGKSYYSLIFAPKSLNLKNAYKIDTSKLFESSLQSIDKQLLLVGGIILFGILLLIYLFAKRDFFKVFSYILFPLSCILVFTYGKINILQIFMLFIILALSIDYGIYMVQSSKQAKQAIFFSLVSTFAGFGVLIFSSIGVLFYIGEIASLGLLALIILMMVGKNENTNLR